MRVLVARSSEAETAAAVRRAHRPARRRRRPTSCPASPHPSSGRSTWRSTAPTRPTDRRSPRSSRSPCSRRCARWREAGPLLVAVDDVQWLDRASEDALAYAARRLEREPVTFLLARRPGRRTALENAVRRPAGRATHRRARSASAPPASSWPRGWGCGCPTTCCGGSTTPRWATRSSSSRWAGRWRGATSTTLGDLPVPDHVEDLLGLRVADLDDSARRVLLALALDADLRVAQLPQPAGSTALQAGARRGRGRRRGRPGPARPPPARRRGPATGARRGEARRAPQARRPGRRRAAARPPPRPGHDRARRGARDAHRRRGGAQRPRAAPPGWPSTWPRTPGGSPRPTSPTSTGCWPWAVTCTTPARSSA